MGSRSWFLVLGAAFALGGCGDDTTTIVQGGASLTGNFPGTQIIDYLVSDDGRAFNHSGAKITKGIQVFWNSSNGNAVVLSENYGCGSSDVPKTWALRSERLRNCCRCGAIPRHRPAT